MLRSPIGPCVRVCWGDAVEFVPIHPKCELPQPFETVEYWVKEVTWVRYRPQITRVRRGGKIYFEIKYELDEHPELAKPGIPWGTSHIIIDESSRSVSAQWADQGSPTSKSSSPARLIEQCERARSNARPVVRNQGQLRELLLHTDRVCAITGEDTHSTLECAHIVSVEKNGFEIDRNAILLRADLHCLYDSGYYEISADGEVIKVSEKLSKYYRRLLKGKKLNIQLTRRVRISLTRRLDESRTVGQGPI